MKHRTVARVLVTHEDKILFSVYEDQSGIFYALPGGEIQDRELAQEAAFRECLEETGYKVVVGELVLVKEFIKNFPEIEEWKDGIHQVELIFKCDLEQGLENEIGKQWDRFQISVEWIDISTLPNYRIYPTQDIALYLDTDAKLHRYLAVDEM